MPTCKVAKGESTVGPEADDLLQACNSLIFSAQLLQGYPHARERVGIIGAETNSLLQGSKDCLSYCSQAARGGKAKKVAAQAH